MLKPSKKRLAKGAGAKNPNWKGGRIIASNGYVKVLVGTAHHLADSKGYAYEHRLVAEKMLGRRLWPFVSGHNMTAGRLLDGAEHNGWPP